MLGHFSKVLMIGGILIFLLGVVLAVGSKFGLGNLTGDFAWHKGDTSIYFPVVTSIVISIVLTVVLNIVLRFFR